MRFGPVGSGSRCGLALAALAAFGVAPRPALAQICFSEPASLPGLAGVPDWTAPGTLRSELLEPRWLAAPTQSFENDATAAQAHYRLLVDAAHTELAVSIWAPSDPGSASNADVVYLGFTTDGTTATLAKAVSIGVPTLGRDPRVASTIQQFTYDAGGTPWSTSLGSPSWLVEPAGFLDSDGATWGISFKIKLSDAGLSAQQPFKLLIAAHVQNEPEVPASVNLSTPDPGAGALQPGTLLIEDPTQWTTTLALDAGCPEGIALDASQLGTRHPDGSDVVDTSPGGVNHFFARPAVPSSLALFEGLFEARFYLVPCAADASPDATWLELGAGAPVTNGAAPTPDDQTLELVCPANTQTTTCGVPSPKVGTHCLAVGLQQAAGQLVRFESAVAYRELALDLAEVGAGGGDAGGSGGEGDGISGGAGSQSAAGAPGSSSGGEPNGSNKAGMAGADDNSVAGTPMSDGGEDDGCGCRLAGGHDTHAGLAFSLVLALLRRRHKRRGCLR